MTIYTSKSKPVEVSVPPSESHALIVRSAQPSDAERISEMVNAHAAQGLTLPRSVENVLACLGEFVVVDRDGMLVACGALTAISPALGEIRSIAVMPEAKGTGGGRGVVEFLVDLAFVLELDELVLLTKIPAFFAKFGFGEIDAEQAPRVFLDEAIAGRGRTIAGRTIMYRSIVPAV